MTLKTRKEVKSMADERQNPEATTDPVTLRTDSVVKIYSKRRVVSEVSITGRKRTTPARLTAEYRLSLPLR